MNRVALIFLALLSLAFSQVGTAAEPSRKDGPPTAPALGSTMSFSGTKIVVADLAAALKFYAGVLEMKEVSRYERPGEFQEIMLAYPGQPAPQLVLVHYQDGRRIQLGNGYGYLVFVTPDIRATIGKVQSGGYKLVEPARTMADLGISVGFVEDHEGRPIELVEIGKK